VFDNVVLKMNMKAKGLNHELATSPALVSACGGIDFIKSLLSGTMFFGIMLSHPASTKSSKDTEVKEPTCIGFASNSHGSMMIKGDFGYQKGRKMTVDADLLSARFKASIQEYYLKSGTYPKHVVVYRAGLSDGELSACSEHEYPVLLNVLDDMKQSNGGEFGDPKLTLIVVNNNCTHRIFKPDINPGDRAPQQNVSIGTVVSSSFTNETKDGFVMVAHKALQGTARPVQYTVVKANRTTQIEHIQLMSFALCFNHGIVNSPTALPSALASAKDLAKRAKNNWLTRRDTGDVASLSTDSAVYREGAGDQLTEEQKEAIKAKEAEFFADLNIQLQATIKEHRFWA